MGFKESKVAFSSKNNFTDDMKRFVVDEAARFTTDSNEAASASLDEMAEKAVRFSAEKNKRSVSEQKQIIAEIKDKKKELKEKSIHPSEGEVSGNPSYYQEMVDVTHSRSLSDENARFESSNPKLHETLPHHLTFLMDEFANVTLPDSFVEKLSTMRSRNMSAVIIVQNLIQLKRKFPKFDMDKDLIGNCSIIDILGAPDMDSCEYLSKHFGTQTIHKASDSDAKDYKGSSSRSEDVMQKPLLSAEDIFAMKKDGECAIVIKGADPLFETKCRMEKTPFVKLLCRKHNPYDPKKTRQKREMFKAENSSFFLCGEVAEAQAKKIREAGSPIIRLTEADVNNLILAGKMDAPVTTLKLTEAMQKTLHENYERYVDEHSNIPVDFSIYKDKDDDSMEARNRYVRRAETVQNLIQAGYTKAQISFLYELIMADYGADRIQKMFPTDCTIDEIKNFAKIL